MTSQNCALPYGDRGPHPIPHVPWAHPSPQPKPHLDRFSSAALSDTVIVTDTDRAHEVVAKNAVARAKLLMRTRVGTGLRWRHNDVAHHTATGESCGDRWRRRDHVVVGGMWRWCGRQLTMIIGRYHITRFWLSTEWRHHGAGARTDRARPPRRPGERRYSMLTSRKEGSRRAGLLTLSLILTPLSSSVFEPHLQRRHRRYTHLNCNAKMMGVTFINDFPVAHHVQRLVTCNAQVLYVITSCGLIGS